MILKTLATGSAGNCYVLTSDSGKHLILDAGISLPEIKKGIDYDVGNLEGCIITHSHADHSKAVSHLKDMGVSVWQPYKDTNHKRLKTKIGCFQISSFDVPHNGCENRAFIIKVDGVTILYATDFEFIPYDLSNQGINVMLIELNYLMEMVSDDNNHIQHLCRGHAEAKTTLEFVKLNSRKLHTVLFCHMSRSGNLDRRKVENKISDYIPPYIRWHWCVAGEEYNISPVPF